ncbi:MAG: cyclic lactone autoinducer peptide [Thermincola sp.]|jgi:hypothetical protein|nr:cyclic lactone autoinducer peptide [Thermincola sp.]MDT3701720.1 cyclic lactone autoinducer peptide [Thermincola sp.]
MFKLPKAIILCFASIVLMFVAATGVNTAIDQSKMMEK